MAAPFDLSKLRKAIDKSIVGMSYGFNDPTTWLDTGCYALNYLISDNFYGGCPLEGKFTLFAGDSGSGKSYIASANIVIDAQKKGVYVVLIDTENSLDESWLKRLGVDTSDEYLQKINGATIDDIGKLISTTIDGYNEMNASLAYEKRGKLLFVIDSLGMTVTPNQIKQTEEGDQKGDMGIKAKQITHLLRVMLSKIGSQPIGLIATNHVYDSQDKYTADTISGGKMLEFTSSIIVQMNKFLLREDANGDKLADGGVSGIWCRATVRKSRYAKPFEKLAINIPYDTGMDKFSGLFDLFLAKGLLVKEGIKYTYTSPVTGEIFSEKKKNYKSSGVLNIIMNEKNEWDKEKVGEGFGANADAGDDE